MLYRLYIDKKQIIETFDNVHTSQCPVKANNIEVFKDGDSCGNFNVTDGGAYALSVTNVFEHVSHTISMNLDTNVVTVHVDIDTMEVL